jgi:hypothetical protein
MIDERAGDERSWRYTYLKIYILLRKSIFIFKKIYLRNPVNTQVRLSHANIKSLDVLYKSIGAFIF